MATEGVVSRVLGRPRASSASQRVGPRPGEVIDRSKAFSFSWEGADYRAFDGDTIASALSASGVRVFSRSFKYHRPRGILSASFHDPGCTVQVDDEPNVRAAHRRVAAGMVVKSQNSWPSLRLDIGTANQVVAPFIGAGFYYKTFIKPQRLWPYYEKVLQRFAGGGRVAAELGARSLRQEVRPPGGARRGWRSGWHGRRAGGRGGRSPGDAGRGGVRARRAPALGRPGRPRAARAAARRGREPGRHRGAGQLRGHRSLRRQLDRRAAAQQPARRRTARQGSSQDARRRPGPHRAAVCVRGQRPAGCHAEHGRPPARQSVRREARDQGGCLHGQRRGRRRRRRSAERRSRHRTRGRRSLGRPPRAGPGQPRARGGRPRRRLDGRMRPPRHRGRLDGANAADEHGRRPADLRRERRPLRAGIEPSSRRARDGRDRW